MQPNHSIDRLLPQQFKTWTDTDQKIWEAAQHYFPMLDSTGLKYNLHLFRVGQRAYELVLHHEKNLQKAQEARQVGMVHDFLEDISQFQNNPNKLLDIGIASHLIPSVLSVTHKKGQEAYSEAMVRAKADPIGKYVKLADLTDNSLLARFPIGGQKVKFLTPLSKAINRHQKYFLSYLFICGTITKEEYFQEVTPYL